MVKEKSMKLNRGLALADLLAFGAILVVVAAIAVPTLERARELSKRMTCSINLKGIGVAGAAYAEGNDGRWMTPPFKAPHASDGVAYVCSNSAGDPLSNIGCVGFDRHRQSKSPTPVNPAGGSTTVTTTRAYWMLVRSGDITVKQFICPSSLYDETDPTELIDLYYDFQSYQNISYGYLVPFGPVGTRPQDGRDSRVVFAADKGPYYSDGYRPEPSVSGPNFQPLQWNDQPRYWQAFNSPNHGGLRFSDGQNALFADGRVEFHRKPAFGADHDNIYTLIPNVWDPNQFNLIHGETPHQAAYVNPYPGQGTLGFEEVPASDSTTDSLIYP